MRSVVAGIMILLLAIGCARDNEDHLPPEQMEQVLLDVQLAEIYSSMAGKDSTHNTGIRSQDSLVVFYREVLAHHNITLEQFSQSMNWYRRYPDKLDSIYVRAMERLSKDGEAAVKKLPGH